MRDNLRELRDFLPQNPCLSLPWRSLSGPYASPSEVAHGLSSYGRKIANLELVFPFPKPSKEKLNPFLNSYTLGDTISISPHACFDKNSVDSVWCQSVSSRGKNYLHNILNLCWAFLIFDLLFFRYSWIRSSQHGFSWLF